MKESKTDVLIIGAGVGGLCAAAKLITKGIKVTVAESLPYVGGRFSSRDCKGFQVTTGAIMVPYGETSIFNESFDDVGVKMRVREAKGGFQYKLQKGTYTVPDKGGLFGMINFALEDEKKAKEIANLFKHAMTWMMPSDAISFKEWLMQYTDNQDLHDLFQGYIGAFIGVNSYECPTAELFRFLRDGMTRFKFGVSIHGNADLMDSLAEGVTNKGVRLSTETYCKKIIVENYRAIGAIIEKNGVEETVYADYIVSNVGPNMTVELSGEEHFERSYMTLLKERQSVTPVIHLAICAREPLHEFPGIICTGGTRRLVFMESPTMTCPELAPDGWHLSNTFSVPANTTGPLRLEETIELVKQDILDFFPKFKEAEVLLQATHHREWPAMRRWPGFPMPTKTPVENLYNVGDGCMPRGFVGIEAAAMSSKDVVEDILIRG